MGIEKSHFSPLGKIAQIHPKLLFSTEMVSKWLKHRFSLGMVKKRTRNRFMCSAQNDSFIGKQTFQGQSLNEGTIKLRILHLTHRIKSIMGPAILKMHIDQKFKTTKDMLKPISKPIFAFRLQKWVKNCNRFSFFRL